MGVYSRPVESSFTQNAGTNGEEESNSRTTSQGTPDLGDVVANVGSRVQEILDSAERIARDIRGEAEASSARLIEERRREADRILEERLREFNSVAQTLALRVEGLQREATALVQALEDARNSLSGLAQPAPPTPASTTSPPPPPSPQPPTPPSEPASPAASGVSQGDRISEQAILRATQMAVAGIQRTEIESMLRTEFGIDDPTAVVDAMLRSERA